MNHLRDVRASDKQMILEWRNRPEVARYMYSDHVITLEEHDRWFESALRDPTRKYWIIVSDGADVGLVNLYQIDSRNRRCYWAFYVSEAGVRGKGVGSFVEYSVMHHVFDELKLNKLCGEVLAFNEVVANMHMSFGFQQEGLFRQHVIKDGCAHDVVALAMLRQEWDLQKPAIEARLRRKHLLR